jgi:hypothetical protein
VDERFVELVVLVAIVAGVFIGSPEIIDKILPCLLLVEGIKRIVEPLQAFPVFTQEVINVEGRRHSPDAAHLFPLLAGGAALW